jgi:chromate transporter
MRRYPSGGPPSRTGKALLSLRLPQGFSDSWQTRFSLSSWQRFLGYFYTADSRLPAKLHATVGIFLPSFLILVGVTPYFDRLRASPWFARAISGILCSFVGLLLTVTIRFALNVHWDFLHIALAGAAFATLIFKLDILWVILAETAVSVLVF